MGIQTRKVEYGYQYSYVANETAMPTSQFNLTEMTGAVRFAYVVMVPPRRKRYAKSLKTHRVSPSFGGGRREAPRYASKFQFIDYQAIMIRLIA
jgi:hypothetical protein